MEEKKDPKNGDYEIGYRKPPKSGQWKTGQSGNPKGRAKGAKGLRTILKQEAYARQTIRIAGEEVSGSRLELTVMTQMIRAAAGDGKSADRVLPLIIQLLGVEDPGHKQDQLSPHDQALLDAWRASEYGQEDALPDDALDNEAPEAEDTPANETAAPDGQDERNDDGENEDDTP